MNEASRNRALRILTRVLAALFVVTGASKLADVAPSPENFTRWGLSLAFMHAVGAVEVAGGIALLVRSVAPIAAIGLLALMIGAARTGIVYREALHVALPIALIPVLAVVATRGFVDKARR